MNRKSIPAIDIDKLALEDKILIRCARLTLSPEDYQVIRELLAADTMKWEFLIEKATWQRLLPILSRHLLSKELSSSTPQPMSDKLKTIGYSSLARNMILQNELTHFLTLLNQADIPTIVLKGAALLGTVYNDISLRPMTDIDLLVQPDQINRSISIALSEGFELIEEFDRDTSENSSFHHPPFLRHPEKKIRLEIHKHIVDTNDPYYFDLDDFWSRACQLTVLDTHALTLTPEDHLIHFCIHFILDRRYHSQNSLGQLCDISELIQRYQDTFDWTRIETKAKTHNLGPGLFFVFYLCNQLLDTPIPEHIMKNLQPSDYDFKRTEQFIHRRVFDNKPWLVHDLVSHDSEYNTAKAFGSAFVRFIKSGLFFNRNKYANNSARLTIQRMQDKTTRLMRAIFRPSELKEDLTLDRWLHDLYD